eukprot:g2077.t1
MFGGNAAKLKALENELTKLTVIFLRFFGSDIFQVMFGGNAKLKALENELRLTKLKLGEVEEERDDLKNLTLELQKVLSKMTKDVKVRENENDEKTERVRAAGEENVRRAMEEYGEAAEELSKAKNKTLLLKTAAKKFKHKVEKEKQDLRQDLDNAKQEHESERARLRETHERALRDEISSQLVKHSKRLEEAREQFSQLEVQSASEMKDFTERANLEKSKLEEESRRLRESLKQHTERLRV